MNTHEDREAHEAEADEVERELDEMEERSDRLHEEIEGTGDEWERKKRDSKVPGAAGEPSEAEGDFEDREGEDSG